MRRSIFPHPSSSLGFALGALLALALAPAATAQVSFQDITQAAGIDFVGSYGGTLPPDVDLTDNAKVSLEIMQRNMGNGAAVSDYDGDGDLDVFFCGQLGKPSALYRNDLGTGTFTNVTGPAGFRRLGQARVASFVDLDNDGWQDLIVGADTRYCGTAQPTTVWRNDGDGTFTNMTKGSGLDMVGYIIGGMGLVDYEHDGRVDIYLTTWGALQNGKFTLLQGHNRLFRNNGNFKFIDVTRKMGLEKFESNSFTPIFADFDSDGDADLYLAVDAYEDRFYRYDGQIFVEETQLVGATHVGTDMGVTLCDFDDDGDVDLYCANVTDPLGAYGGNTLLVNQLIPTGQLTFDDQAAARGVFDTGWGWGTEFVDVDNDGDRDLYVVNGFDEWAIKSFEPAVQAGWVDRPADLFLNDGTGNFSGTSGTGAEVIGDARCTICFDYDRDGDQDLLVTHMDAAPVLLRNDSLNTGHWLDVSLIGSGTVSRDAIGARMQVVAGGKVYNHEVIGGGSYLAGRPFEAHFGLGSATIVDELRVYWPGGGVTVLEDVAVDQHVVVQ